MDRANAHSTSSLRAWLHSIPLRVKLMAAFFVLSALTALPITLMTYQATTKALDKVLGIQLHYLAASKALAVGDLLARQINAVEALSLNSVLYEAVVASNAQYNGAAGEIQAGLEALDRRWMAAATDKDSPVYETLNNPAAAELRRFQHQFPNLAEVFLTDRHGALVAAAARTTDYYQADEAWWQAVNAGQGDHYIGAPMFDDSAGILGVRLAVPVYSEDQTTVIGVLATTYHVAALEEALNVVIDDDSNLWVALLLPSGYWLRPAEDQFEAVPGSAWADLRTATASPYTVLDFEDASYLVSQADVATLTQEPSVAALGWRVVVRRERQSALAPIIAQRNVTLLWAGLIVVVAAGAGILMALWLARPVIRLTAIAQQIGAGHLDARATIEARDEIGTLATTFNAMTDRLQQTLRGLEQRVQELQAAHTALEQRTHEFTALYDTALEINAQQNLTVLLQAIVERAAKLLNAPMGGLYLLKPESQVLELVVSHNFPPAYIGTTLQAGEGLAGRVFQAGQPLMVEDYHHWEGRAAQYSDISTRRIVGVPLTVGQQIIGVLTVGDDEQAGLFTEDEIQLVRMFADQAATAINNARLLETTQRELAERKRAEEELHSRLEDIARFSALAVGRERRMVELKQEINALHQALGQTAPYAIAHHDLAIEPETPAPEPAPALFTSVEEASYNLAYLLPLDQMQWLLDSFCDAVGVASAIIDLEGRVLVGARWQHICTDFHRVNPITCARCIESDTILAGQPVEGEHFAVYQCRNGLVDAAAPIIIEGRHVANAFVGQFLLEPPDPAFFRQQAHEFGFDETVYLEAMAQVPIVPRYKLPAILSFLSSFAKLVTLMGLERLRGAKAQTALIEHTEALRRRNQALQQQQEAVLNLAQDMEEARLALQESETRFRLLSESALLGIYIIQDNRFQYVNPAMTQIFGYTVAEFLQAPSSLMPIHPDDRPYVAESVRQRLTGEKDTAHYVTRGLRKDGEVIDIEILGRRIDYAGRPAVMGNLLDITESKRTESALRRLAAAVEQLGETVVITDLDGKIVYANPHFEIATGYTVAEMLGHDHSLIKSGLHDAAFYCQLWDTITAGRMWSGTFINKRKDGQLYYEAATIFPIRDAEGVTINYAGVKRDITEQVRAAEEREKLLVQIRESAEQVRQIMDTVPEGVLLLDTHLRIVLCNPIADEYLSILADVSERDTAQPLTHLGGRPIGELLTAPPRGLWHEVVAKRRRFHVVARAVEASPAVEGWVVVIHDVTREYENQQNIQRQERLAGIGQLAAGIAHDFNNIIAVIMLYSQMSLRIPDLPDKLRERLAIIAEQGQHASALINQILDFSRSSVLDLRPLDLVPLLKETVKLWQRTLPEDIRIELTYDAEVALVNADLTRIQQVLMNLAVNARDAMPDGGTLSLHLAHIHIADRDQTPLPDLGLGTWVAISMTDTGTGIPDDVLPYIFEPFYTTKAPGEGTGLGLAQVYGIITHHAGYIDVKTKVGAGSTFIVYLPALSPTQPAETLALDKDLPLGHGEMILVVEDNPTTRAAILGSLEVLHYRACEAANGEEALKVFAQSYHDIALVLTDLVMPVMGGKTLARELHRQAPALNIIVMSGNPLDSTDESWREVGVRGWIQKPPTLEQLAKTLAGVILCANTDSAKRPSGGTTIQEENA
ncbi:MAG TPA: PAS domain S-box protein [Anaerolineae bacterium]|nr:PAS domain S-box protein [Anaerolineae bacterium]HQI83021.1 PAS domain S-box protein [Anaerolineae bacterium]